jgi:hypothetical protein
MAGNPSATLLVAQKMQDREIEHTKVDSSTSDTIYHVEVSIFL